MPACISVEEYMREVKEDIDSPPTSNFVNKMGQCRQTVHDLEESLDKDREGLSRMKKAVKNMYVTGQTFVSAGQDLSEGLQKLKQLGWREDEQQLSEACNKFSVVIREHSQLLAQLLTNQRNYLLNPLDSALKGELKGVKGDLKRPFDKAAKDYDTKFSKIEKERKQQAKEAGLIKNAVGPSEIAEDMSKERRLFQLHMCEYLIKVNEIKTKKGVEFLQKLVEYYYAYCKYFEEGLKTWEHFGTYVSELSDRLKEVRHRHEEERRLLVETRTLIKNSLTSENCDGTQPGTGGAGGYLLHQPCGNEMDGTNKTGYLFKKSDSKVRRVWQKRLCEVRESVLLIYHSDTTAAPVSVPLLTCQVKPHPDDPKCFHLVSYNRTYHLMGESEADTNLWISVLRNSKEGALQKAFLEERSGSLSGASEGGRDEGGGGSFRELQQRIISYVLALPGNNHCCDCNGTNDVTWLSTNYGIVVCIECSGIHRDMGVHVSRIQSLTLDKIGTAQLLLARHLGNTLFNRIMEASEHINKPAPSSSMEERREFIQSKYLRKAFVAPCAPGVSPQQLLQEGLSSNSLIDVITAFMQGADLNASINALGETALHVAIECGVSLPLFDFLLQNSRSLNAQTSEGNTGLHYCVIHGRSECLRLLLRVDADPSLTNTNAKTALDIAKERGAKLFVHMLEHPPSGQKKSLFDNVEFEWNLDDDNFTDVSDDDDGWRNGELLTPEKRLRPTSLPPPPGDHSSHHHHQHHHHNHHYNAPESPHSIHRHRHHGSTSSSNSNHHHQHHRNTIIAGGSVKSGYRDYSRHPRPPDCQPPPPPPPIAAKPSSSFLNNSSSNNNNNMGSLKKRPAPYPPPTGTSLRSGMIVTEPSSHYASTSCSTDTINKQYNNRTTSDYASTRRDSNMSLDRDSFDRRDSGGGGTYSTYSTGHYSTSNVSSEPPDMYGSHNLSDSTGGYSELPAYGKGFAGAQHAASNKLKNNRCHRRSPSSDSSNSIFFVPTGSKSSNNSAATAIVDSVRTCSGTAISTSTIDTHLSGGQGGGGDVPSQRAGVHSPLSSAPSTPPHSGRLPTDALNGGRSSDSLSSVLSDVAATGVASESLVGGRPVPPPRPVAGGTRRRRCRALYDCAADLTDELSFQEGEIIIIVEEETEDGDWMEGFIEGQPHRRGKLPVNFVHMLSD
ncbi:arf-GAP with SH3 domain, ANK repeat and PH domain-containing protein 2 isoform X2 [Hyalella azteca]|uniref:Arf-GAP with SH3 domain, ANK repeat and PH domain-containing protein 2 isoform X2 n=1 Tax=Hyalella azteca TaxID=294128 RepID=A0A8B7NFP8_HYAAZ|nr:arf-GAP with SH3 domain, ANK repeat and PH domain-containing protein 2 isoform X2 [Hyalella azteca]